MMQKKLSNNQYNNEESRDSIAWDGDIYLQVMGTERAGQVCGLGLGPTPSRMWGKGSVVSSSSMPSKERVQIHKLQKDMKVM